MVFVDSQSTDPLNGFTRYPGAAEMLCIETVAHQVALHAQIICQCHMAGAMYLFQNHMEHQWGTLAQCFYAGIGP
jgi:hypothetical protein